MKAKFMLVGMALVAAFSISNAQTPKQKIPEPVLKELKVLNSQFLLSLQDDCGVNVCYPRGCFYLDHIELGSGESSELPGIPIARDPSIIDKQIFLSRATCEFAHESEASSEQVNALRNRLDQKLSLGYLKVQTRGIKLPPKDQTLLSMAALKQLNAPDAPVVPEGGSGGDKPTTFADKMVEESWQNISPHLFWMLGVLLVSLCAIVVIWAYRRIGTDSLEDKVMAKRMNLQVDAEAQAAMRDAMKEDEEAEGPPIDDAVLVATKTSDVVKLILDNKEAWTKLSKQYLQREQFLDLFKAGQLLVGQDISILPEGSQYAPKKLQFERYVAKLSEGESTSKTKVDLGFLKSLEHQLKAHLMVQDDHLDAIQEMINYFTPQSMASQLHDMPPHLGRVILCLYDAKQAREITEWLRPQTAVSLCEVLMVSNRVAVEELAFLKDWIDSVLNQTSRRQGGFQLDFLDLNEGVGVELDTRSALSALLEVIPAEDRKALTEKMRTRNQGLFGDWIQDSFYPGMLLGLKKQELSELLLESNPRDMKLWLEMRGTEEINRKILGAAPKSLKEAFDSPLGELETEQVATTIDKVEDKFRKHYRKLYRTGKMKVEKALSM